MQDRGAQYTVWGHRPTRVVEAPVRGDRGGRIQIDCREVALSGTRSACSTGKARLWGVTGRVTRIVTTQIGDDREEVRDSTAKVRLVFVELTAGRRAYISDLADATGRLGRCRLDFQANRRP